MRMPPKPKFTREQIVNAALALISERGVEALTARELAHRLDCSTRPIFTMFKDMDELRGEARRLAAKRIEESAQWEMQRSGEFLQAQLRIVRFAVEDPNLYKLVFLTNNGPLSDLDDVEMDTHAMVSGYATFIAKEYGLTQQEAELLFMHAWTLCNGVGAISATQRAMHPANYISRFFEEDLNAMSAYLKARREVDDKSLECAEREEVAKAS